MPYNQQPAFSYAPILKVDTIDPHVNTDNSVPLGNSDVIFTGSANFGTIINKITISACGDLTYTNVLPKLIYIYLQTGATSGSLYYSDVIPATTMSVSTPNPVITFEPTGGLLLNQNDKIYIAASQNGSSGTRADWIAYTVEGSYF